MSNNLGEQIAWLLNETFSSNRDIVKTGRTDISDLLQFEYIEELARLQTLPKEHLINIILNHLATFDSIIEELKNEDETLWDD
jgi:small-conductance mechanosensitive channel